MPLFADLALAFGALLSFGLVGLAALKWVRAPFTGLEALAFGAGLGVPLHALVGFAVALSPAKQPTACVLFLLLWAVSAWTLWRTRHTPGEPATPPWWHDGPVRSTLAILALFIISCVGITHLRISFPRVLGDGIYIFKEHTLPVQVQVLTGGLPVDNYLPFVVEEYLLREVSFTREHPIIPGQEVANRPILLALAVTPFRAALDPPPRQHGPMGRFTYQGITWPDAGSFMEGEGFRQFLAVGIALNALFLLGAALLFATHGPRSLFVPGLLLLATSPYYLAQTIFTWPKLLAAFFLLLALHALTRKQNPVWVALCASLAYWSHPYATAFLLGFGCHYTLAALSQRRRDALTPLLVYGAAAALVLSPWFLWTRVFAHLPSDLFAQNFSTPESHSLSAQIWVRLVNLHQAVAAEMFNVYPFRTETVFQRALTCLPGILGLLTLPAYAGCVLCLPTHRTLVLYGVLVPGALLMLLFSWQAYAVLMAFQSIGICLWFLGLAVLARAPRPLALALVAAQLVLQLSLLFLHGRDLHAALPPAGLFYRLLDHRPDIHDSRYQINFHVDIAIGDDHAESIWSEPPASLVYPRIRLPATPVHFRCRVAIHPLVWKENAADGAEFALEVRPVDSPNAPNANRRVWSTTLDPAHQPGQRAWLPVDVDLSEFAGRTIDLTLKNGPGPANNDYADWCIWADPQLTP